MKCILRLLFQVRLKTRANGLFDKAPARRFFGDFINFSDPFFSSLFSRLLRYKLNSFLVVMALLLNHDGFGRNWTIVLRDFAKSLRELKNIFFQKRRFHLHLHCRVNYTYNLRTWFILTRSKQNWLLKWKKKSLLFLPALACRRDRVWFAFIWWHFPNRRVSGKTPRADHKWQNPPRLS